MSHDLVEGGMQPDFWDKPILECQSAQKQKRQVMNILGNQVLAFSRGCQFQVGNAFRNTIGAQFDRLAHCHHVRCVEMLMHQAGTVQCGQRADKAIRNLPSLFRGQSAFGENVL